MKIITQKTMGVLTIAVALASCSKGDNPNLGGTDECWYTITLDDEIAHANLFGQDNIYFTSTNGIYDGEEEGGVAISIFQTKADGEKRTAFMFGFELEKFNRETPVGTVFTADSAADMFVAHSLITPAWGGTQYAKDYGDGDAGVPTLPTLTVEENSNQRIRFRLAGMVSKFEGGFDNNQPAGLVPIGGEFVIGRSHYIETPINGNYIAGVNCECKEQ